ncbi:MAG: hypothetical protein K6F75_02950 [Butyrivibrio sp.]|nr:hypothetical protein [Butyrivibrio sp.]
MDEVVLVIKEYASLAKVINAIGKFSPEKSMAEIKEIIEKGDPVLACSYTDGNGIGNIIKCYKELIAEGTSAEIYEHGRICEQQLLENLVKTYGDINADIEEIINEEES